MTKVGEEQKTCAQRDCHFLEEGHDELGLCRQGRRAVQKPGGSDGKNGLPEVLPAGDESLAVLSGDLQVIVHPADNAERQGHQQHGPDIAIAEITPGQRGNQDDNENQRPAHRRGACFAEVALRAIFTNRLPDLVMRQLFDHIGTNQERHGQGCDHADHGAERQVLKHRKAGDVFGQELGQPEQHQQPSVRARAMARSLKGSFCPFTSW